jgi:hypothetical protein
VDPLPQDGDLWLPNKLEWQPAEAERTSAEMVLPGRRKVIHQPFSF